MPRKRRVRIGGRLPRLVERPALRDALAPLLGGEDVAARDLGQGQIDDDRLPARQGAGEGDRVGAEQSLRAAPGRHRGRRIGEEERHQPGFGEAFDRVAGGAAMVRAADRRDGDALIARHLGQSGHGLVERRIGEAMRRVDRQHGRPRARDDRRREAVDLAGLGLRRVGRHARQAVALEPVRLGGDESARNGARVARGRPAPDQGVRDQILRLGERQRRHRVTPRRGGGARSRP